MARKKLSLLFLVLAIFISKTNSRTLHGIKLKKDVSDDGIEIQTPQWSGFESNVENFVSPDAPEKLTVLVTGRKSADAGAERDIEPERLYVDDLNTFSARVSLGTDAPSSEVIRFEMLYFGEDNSGIEQILREKVLEREISSGTWILINSEFQVPDLADDVDWFNIKVRVSGPDAEVDFEFREVRINGKYIDPGITNFTTDKILRWGVPLGALVLVILVISYSSIKQLFSKRAAEPKKENMPDVESKIPPMKRDEPLIPHTTPQKRLHPGYYSPHHPPPQEFHQNEAAVS